MSRWLSGPLCATAIQSNPTQLKQIVWQHTCCVICVCRPRPPSMLVLLLPRKIVILAFTFWGREGGRQGISSCYRLRPSSAATPMHLGAKTNTQETRDQTRKYTQPNTLLHTHQHTPTHCGRIHWSAFCFAFKAALFRVCVCFNLFLFISLFRLVTKVKVGHIFAFGLPLACCCCFGFAKFCLCTTKWKLMETLWSDGSSSLLKACKPNQRVYRILFYKFSANFISS